ncbi:hypothetical protein R3W88_009569 [Solanum pinnatisectum]|uniref:Uncharacterized protein n=1 Tax=Solanum pinnatisectum TaxID=50273 RepID=A0AAV9MBM3_9SOLN|nr:hypothetical protein R3W88_009569 [Solanum pinnatisectum]
MEDKTTKDSESINSNRRGNSSQKRERGLQIEGYSLEGISIAGYETVLSVPSPSSSFSSLMDHIGGLPMYVATRSLYRMRPPTIIKLFEAHRAMDHSELNHTLIRLDVAFKTYNVIPSQGYIVYSIKQKLKQEYVGLPGDEIKKLKLSDHEHFNST